MILTTALTLLLAAAQPTLRKGFSGYRALGRRLDEAVDNHLWPGGKPNDKYAFVVEYTRDEVVFEKDRHTYRVAYEDDGLAARVVGQPELVTVDYVRLEKSRRGRVRGVELGPLLGPLLFEAQSAELSKGAGHKYLRRVPTGNPKRPWRYIYSVAAVTRHHDDAHFDVGSKFQVAHAGKTGHFEVIGRDGEKLRVKHDESGHETTLTVDALKAMMAREHAHLVDAHRDRLKRDLAAAQKHGTDKQVQRLRDEAARHGHGDLGGGPAAVIEAFAKRVGGYWAHHVNKLRSGTELHHLVTMTDKGVEEGVLLEVRPGGKVSAAAIEGRKRTPLAVGELGAHLKAIDGRAKRQAAPKKDPHAALTPDDLFTGDAVGLTKHGVEVLKRVRGQGAGTLPEGIRAALVDEGLVDGTGKLTRDGSSALYHAEQHHEAEAERAKWHKEGVDGRDRPYDPVVDEHVARHKKAATEHRREARNHPKGSVARTAHLRMAADHKKQSQDWHHSRTIFSRYPKNRAHVVRYVAGLRTASERLHDFSKNTFTRHAAEGTPWAGEREQRIANAVHSDGSLAELHAAAPAAPATFTPRPRATTPAGGMRRGKRFASKDKGHPNLAGVFYSADGKAVATDGHRMALIPVKDVPADWIGTVRTAKGGTSRRFPKSYGQVIPTDTKLTHAVELDAAHLQAVLKAVRATLPKGAHTSELRIVDGKALLYTPGDADRGLQPSTVSLGAVAADTRPFAVALNPRYLHDAVQGARGAVRIRRTENDYEPMTVERVDGELHVIMPRR